MIAPLYFSLRLYRQDLVSKKIKIGRVQWLKPAIPALWEADTGASRGQEFKIRLANMLNPYLY